MLCTLLASEIWLKEGNLDFPFGTTFEVFDFLSNSDFEKAIKVLPDSLEEKLRRRIVTKARNLQQAAFGTTSPVGGVRGGLSFEKIQEIHREVVKDLGIPSELRTMNLGPAGMNHMYVLPRKIENQLDSLISFINEKLRWAKSMEDEEDRLKKSFALVSLFFCEFCIGNDK